MAILSKIRERTIFLILIIGMALFAFVVGDAFNGGNSAKVDVVGEVNGETISRIDFSKRLETYKANSRGQVSEIQTMNNVWDGFVRERVFKEQLEKAGVVVGEKEVWESIISMQYFQNDPSFKNASGLFDEEKVKEFIATMRDNAIGTEDGSQEKLRWFNWITTENQIRQNVIRSAYTNLVNAGLGSSLDEGKRDYLYNNSNFTSQYVYVPYSSIADSLVKITSSDYKNYINEHAKEFEVDETRSIKYVKFDIIASEDDKKVIKDDLATFIDDDKNGNLGMKNTKNVITLIDDLKSDLVIDKNFNFKNKLPKEIAEQILTSNIGDVVGPYEDDGYYKLSKIQKIKKMPDSVKSRHILVSYTGSERSLSTRSKEAARKTADSIFKLVKNSSSRFIAIADVINSDGTKGKGGDIGWITKDAAFTPNFDRDFANFIFDNKKGSVKVVETKFGFHIIKVDEQNNFKSAVQMATLSRKIVPSEETESKLYQEAESFASKLSKGEIIDNLVNENNYKMQSGNKLKELDEKIPGLEGSQRQIVRWAFNDKTNLNSVKSFDLDRGYVVAILGGKTAKGLAPVNNVGGEIKPKILKILKAQIIRKKMTGSTLEDIAKDNSVSVKTASKVSLVSPTLSGVGKETGVVGAMSNAKEGEVIKGVEGVKGVFAIKVISKENPTELDNYNTFRKKLVIKTQRRSSQLYNALKEASDIEDFRASIY